MARTLHRRPLKSPTWFHTLSTVALVIGALCAVVVLSDVRRHPQKMAAMNAVWPVTALFGTVFTVGAYFRFGRASRLDAVKAARHAGQEPPAMQQPYAATVGKGALHCGAGCMIGDLLAGWLAFVMPGVAVWFG